MFSVQMFLKENIYKYTTATQSSPYTYYRTNTRATPGSLIHFSVYSTTINTPIVILSLYSTTHFVELSWGSVQMDWDRMLRFVVFYLYMDVGSIDLLFIVATNRSVIPFIELKLLFCRRWNATTPPKTFSRNSVWC